jgi:hypothetical protein
MLRLSLARTARSRSARSRNSPAMRRIFRSKTLQQASECSAERKCRASPGPEKRSLQELLAYLLPVATPYRAVGPPCNAGCRSGASLEFRAHLNQPKRIEPYHPTPGGPACPH